MRFSLPWCICAWNLIRWANFSSLCTVQLLTLFGNSPKRSFLSSNFILFYVLEPCITSTQGSSCKSQITQQTKQESNKQCSWSSRKMWKYGLRKCIQAFNYMPQHIACWCWCWCWCSNTWSFLSWFSSIIFVLHCSSMCGQWESNVSVCCTGLGFADHRPSIFPNYVLLLLFFPRHQYCSTLMSNSLVNILSRIWLIRIWVITDLFFIMAEHNIQKMQCNSGQIAVLHDSKHMPS